MKKKQNRPFLCKSCSKKLNYLALIFFAVIGMFFIGITLLENSGFHITSVGCSSHSMYPNLYCGCIVLEEKNPSKYMINVNDVITFITNRDSSTIHRVVEICRDSNGYIAGFKTKGDNNTQADGCVPENSIVGKVDAYWCP